MEERGACECCGSMTELSFIFTLYKGEGLEAQGGKSHHLHQAVSSKSNAMFRKRCTFHIVVLKCLDLAVMLRLHIV